MGSFLTHRFYGRPEKKPKDPTIRAKFDTYRFADYKDKVIDLLARVAAVSVATVKITREMRAERR